MNNLIKLLLYTILVLYVGELKAKNKIIFSIKNDIFTTIDLENRKKFITIKENKIILDDNGIKQDFISLIIFNHFNKEKKIINNINDKIEEQYNLLNNKYDKLDKNDQFKIIYNSLPKIFIKENIKLDIQRRLIIENELNKNKEIIFDNNFNEINNIYKIEIEMISLNKINNLKIIKEFINDDQNIIQLNDIRKKLDNKQIFYFYKKKFLNFTEKIDDEIKKAIIKNKNYFIINKNNIIILGNIKKTIKKEDNINFSIKQIISNEKIDNKRLKCENLKVNNFSDEIKIINNDNIQYINLNDQIKKNLIQINDKIEIYNNDEYIYIILCEINFEKDFFKNINTNIKINYIAKEIEKDLVLKNKIKYNFKTHD